MQLFEICKPFIQGFIYSEVVILAGAKPLSLRWFVCVVVICLADTIFHQEKVA